MRYALLVLLLLGACNQVQDATDAAYPKYRGKPVSLIFQKWGVPDRTIPGVDGTIYQWRARSGGEECRLEVHTTLDIVKGRQSDNVMGIRGTGDEAVCASWIRML